MKNETKGVGAHAKKHGWSLAKYQKRAKGLKNQNIVAALALLGSRKVDVKLAKGAIAPRAAKEEPFEGDMPVWAWVELLEKEAAKRGLLPAKAKIKKAKGARSRAPSKRSGKAAAGRTSGEVTAKAEMRKIFMAKRNGSSYEQLEQDFGFRPSNGMNAYRVVKRYEKIIGETVDGKAVKVKKAAKKAKKTKKAKKK